MSNDVIKISEAHAIRYRLPGTDKTGRPIKEVNAYILLDALIGGEEVRGTGESQFRNSETGDQNLASWDFIENALPLIKGQSINVSSTLAARESIKQLLARVSETLRANEAAARLLPADMSFRSRLTATLKRNETLRQKFSKARNRTYGGAVIGIEAALYQLAARALGTTVAGVLSDKTNVDRREVDQFDLLRLGSGNYSAVMQKISDVLSRENPQERLWLDFEHRLSLETAKKWVTRFYNQIPNESLTEIVLGRPLLSREAAQYGALVQDAAKKFSASNGTFKVTVAHSRGRDQLDTSNAPEFSYHVVIPAAVGGLQAAYDIAKTSNYKVYLATLTNSGPNSLGMLNELALAAPSIDGILVHPPVSTHSTGTVESDEIPWETFLTADGVRFSSTSSLVDSSGEVFNTFPELPYLQTLGPNGTKGHLMEREALALGMNTVRYSKGAFVATDGKHDPLVFKWSRSPLSSAVALSLCTHKEATRMRLGQAGIPVPRGRTFRNGDFETAREFADLIGFPVVVKPAMGVRGIGVVAGIANQEELSLAFKQLSDSKLGSQDFILEKHVHGGDYRIVVVGDQVVAAILRKPASVVGDGQKTIGELILRKNAQRRFNPHLWGRPIVFDDAARYQLGRVGYDASSIPRAGEVIMLSNSSSLSQGGESFDVLDELHPSIVDACLRTVQAIPDLAFCGVDFLIEDHTKPLEGQEAGICELNAHAAIGNCEYPLYGKPRRVAGTFMDLCVERYDLDVADQRAETVTVMIKVRGKVTGVGYRAWMRRHASQYGITGWVRNVRPREVHAVLSGETMAVTALVAAAVLGPRRSKPTSVSTEHVIAPSSKDFRIVNRQPRGIARV